MNNTQTNTPKPASGLSTKAVLHWVFSFAVYIGVFSYFFYYGNLRTTYTSDGGAWTTYFIERMNEQYVGMLAWTGLILALALLIVSAISFKTRWLRWPVLGVAIVMLLYPFSVVGHFLSNLGPWTTHGQVTTADGKVYVFCDTSFLMGQTMAITEVVHADRYKTVYRVLVDNNCDSPRSWASVIRPLGATDEYGQLYLKNDMLIGVRYDNHCYVAYDLKNKKAYGHEEIKSLSVFACLEAGDAINPTDVSRTCGQISKIADHYRNLSDLRHAESFVRGEPSSGCPPLAGLEEALSGQSPERADAARQILDCYDKAKARLAAFIKSKNDPSVPEPELPGAVKWPAGAAADPKEAGKSGPAD